MAKGGWKLKRSKNSFFCLSVLTVLILAFAAVAAGCGGGTGESYQTVVLEGWQKLQESTRELGEAGNDIESTSDLEDFSGELAAARLEVASFEGELSDLKVPAAFAASQEALEKFLSYYDEYLEAMQDMLDLFLAGGDLSAFPTIAPLLERAEQALRDYRDSQEFNPAALDREVWDVLHVLDEVLGSAASIPGGSKFAEALEIVDAWYSAFNAGDGESMYTMLDAESPILDNYSRQFFLAQVGEAHQSGLRATFQLTDAEAGTDKRGDWYTAFLTVNYGATVDMEGNPVPPASENIQFQLVNRGSGWHLYDIQPGPRIY
jgi:hypothetical protein